MFVPSDERKVLEESAGSLKRALYTLLLLLCFFHFILEISVLSASLLSEKSENLPAGDARVDVRVRPSRVELHAVTVVIRCHGNRRCKDNK